MIVTFQRVYTEILTKLNLTEDTVSDSPELLDSIKLRINQIQDFLFYRKNYEWRKQKFYYTTTPPIETGTASITEGSRAVTISSAVLDDTIKYAHFLVNGRVYKIDPHATITSTTFKLISPYPKDTEAAVDYKIIYSTQLLDPSISSVVNVFIEDSAKKVASAERLTLTRLDLGEPLQLALDGLTNFTFHSAGTVSATIGSTAIVGVGTTFTSAMEGMPFRINESPVVYTIGEVTDTTNLTLKEDYQGSTVSGKGYKIAPEGSLLIQSRPVPDERYFVEVEGLIKPRQLVRPTDISLLPDHSPLIWGSIWYAFETATEKNPVKINMAKSNFRDAMKMFDEQYQIVNHLAWQSEEEIRLRRAGSQRFNPLGD